MPRTNPPKIAEFRRQVGIRCAELEITRAEAARRAGVSRQRFKQWVDQYPHVAPKTAATMAEALRVDPTTLAEWAGDIDEPPAL